MTIPDTVNFYRTKLAEEAQREDDLMLSLYLDFLTKQTLSNPNELEEYTRSMADEDEALIAGVIVDED